MILASLGKTMVGCFCHHFESAGSGCEWDRFLKRQDCCPWGLNVSTTEIESLALLTPSRYRLPLSSGKRGQGGWIVHEACS